MKKEQKQAEIQDWFNNIYKTKEFSYLRPIEAYEIFASILSPHKDQRHLDVACGLGLLLKVMEAHGATTSGIDLSDVAAEKARELNPSSNILVANAEELPFENETFDSVSCIGSIERMLDREKALIEQYRVGRKGAKYIYMVRNSDHWLWKYIQKPFGIYNKEGHQDAKNFDHWKDLFEKCGFKFLNVYPDHWPYLKVMTTILPWLNWDYGKVRKFPRPVKSAYELIFLLEK